MSNYDLIKQKIIKDIPKQMGFRTEPMLNDVLMWHSKGSQRSKYSHFEVHNCEGYFSIYDGEETESKVWDLSKRYLKDQSPELLEWLSILD